MTHPKILAEPIQKRFGFLEERGLRPEVGRSLAWRRREGNDNHQHRPRSRHTPGRVWGEGDEGLGLQIFSHRPALGGGRDSVWRGGGAATM